MCNDDMFKGVCDMFKGVNVCVWWGGGGGLRVRVCDDVCMRVCVMMWLMLGFNNTHTHTQPCQIPCPPTHRTYHQVRQLSSL